MLITFILSCQMASHWARNRREVELADDARTVRIDETTAETQ